MEKLSWSIRVPLQKNKVIRDQLALALGIPFGTLLAVLLFLRAWNGLVLVGGMLALGLLLAAFLFRGTCDLQYLLDDKGITCETQSAQKKRVRVMAAATMSMAVLTANPTAAAAGLLAGTGTKQRFQWKCIRKVKYLEQSRTILLGAGFGETAAVFCTGENYERVRHCIQGFVPQDAAPEISGGHAGENAKPETGRRAAHGGTAGTGMHAAAHDARRVRRK